MTEGSINKVLYNVDQRAATTTAEKKIARDNIGAIGADDVPGIVDDRYKLLQVPRAQTFAQFACPDRLEQNAQGVVTMHCSYISVATDSTNGLMSASDKSKLNSVAYNAEQNVQADWDETDPSSDAYIRNKPSQSVQVQADWDETNTSLPSYIRNKPTIPSGDQLLPAATSADENKVLVVDENGHPVWEDAGSGLVSVAHDTTLTGDGTNSSPLGVNTNSIQEKLTAGTGITITGNTISAAAALTPGNGIQIVNDTVSARVDGTSVDFDQAGNLSVKSPLVLNGQGTQTVVGGNGMSAENTTTHASTTINYGGVTLSDGTNSDTFGLDDLQKLNGIQAGAEANVQANWNEADSSSDAYIKNKPDLTVFATKAELNAKQDVLTPGTGITITNNVISADVDPQVQADWAQSDSSAVDFIKNKPQNLVQDANYVHTDNNFTNAEKSKLDNIQSGAEVNVQANWNEMDSSSDSYIQNKPANLVQDANYVHTDNNFTTSEKTKLAGIQAGAEQNVQADWTQTDSSADDYIRNKPSIPEVPALKELVAGNGVTIVEGADEVTVSAITQTDNNFTNAYKSKLDNIQSGAEVNVQPNWNESNTSSDAYIRNKPVIPAAQVNSDWNASSGVAEILNKPTIPEIEKVSNTLPPVYTPVAEFKVFTDGRVIGDSSNLGVLGPTPSQSDSGKILEANWAGSPAIGTARWVSKPIGVPASVAADENKVLTVNDQGVAEWQFPVIPDIYNVGNGLSKVLDLHTGEYTLSWVYTVGRNLTVNPHNEICTAMPGTVDDASSSADNLFYQVPNGEFAGAFVLMTRRNAGGNYDIGLGYTASGYSSTISFIGTETIISSDNTVTVNPAVYLDQSVTHEGNKFGTTFIPASHKAIYYSGLAMIGPISDTKIAIFKDANGNVKVAFTSMEGKVW